MLVTRLNIVPTNVKSKFLQIRINEEIKHDLQVVAELRGLSTSALIHSLVVKTIRAEKEREPTAFQRDPPERVYNGASIAENTPTIPRLKEEAPAKKRRSR